MGHLTYFKLFLNGLSLSLTTLGYSSIYYAFKIETCNLYFKQMFAFVAAL
jgi:hypothetical protein